MAEMQCLVVDRSVFSAVLFISVGGKVFIDLEIVREILLLLLEDADVVGASSL